MVRLYTNNIIWFRARDIAGLLGFKNTKQAVHYNLDPNCKKFITYNLKDSDPVKKKDYHVSYINRNGLIQLLLSSKKHISISKQIFDWVDNDIIPTLMTKYIKMFSEKSNLLDKQISLINERDLHFKVVGFIRKYYPHAVIYAGLGELQDTDYKRIFSKCCGYTKGQSDIVINNLHKEYNGFTIELKSPTGKGVLSDAQRDFLRVSDFNNHKTLVSNDYDLIITEIIKYMADTRVICLYCHKLFKTIDSLNIHQKYIHRNKVSPK